MTINRTHLAGLELALNEMAEHGFELKAHAGYHLMPLIADAQAAPEAEPVTWREHSVNYAKGEKCPETIETLQAAWARDQELIDDMRHEIARHKTRINRLEQRRSQRHDAELVELIKELIDVDDGGLDDHWRGHAGKELMTRIDAKLAALSVKA